MKNGPKLAKARNKKDPQVTLKVAQSKTSMKFDEYVRALYQCVSELAGLLDDQLTPEGVSKARAALEHADVLEQQLPMAVMKHIDPDYSR